MRTLTRFFALIFIFLLVPAPLGAQVASSTATTTAATTTSTTGTQSQSQNSSSNSNSALGIGLGIGAGIVGLSLFASNFTSAAISIPAGLASRSFGGRIVTAIPCVVGGTPALQVTIRPAGVLPITYIWTSATITRLQGPPRTPGQQVLGIYDVPFVCYIPAKVPIPLFGLRMTMVGTSLF